MCVGRASVAIVTTARGVSDTLAMWCAYHLSIGFDFLFVYLDAPDVDRAGCDKARALGTNVVVIECHSCGREGLLSALPSEAWKLRQHCCSEVMARQLVDAWHCMVVLAPASGVDWLLHLDADELFDPGSSTVTGSLFWRLSVTGARCVTFQNWEAIPESDSTVNPFLAHTLFKKPENLSSDRYLLNFWEPEFAYYRL